MSSTLKFSGQSGLVAYAIIRDTSDYVWNGSFFVVYNSANFATYAVSLTEQGSSGYYSGTFPSGIASGLYYVTYQARVGGSPAQTDDVVYQTIIEWNGTAVVVVAGTGVIDIGNLALSHIGQQPMVSLSEDTPAAKRFNVIYPESRDEVLREHNWSFARVIAALTPSVSTVFGWANVYARPSSCLAIRRVFTDTTSKDPVSVDFKQVGPLIAVDGEAAYVEYTTQITDPALWEQSFRVALSYRLAGSMAKSLIGDDALAVAMMNAYYGRLAEAKRMNAQTYRVTPAVRTSSYTRAR